MLFIPSEFRKDKSQVTCREKLRLDLVSGLLSTQVWVGVAQQAVSFPWWGDTCQSGSVSEPLQLPPLGLLGAPWSGARCGGLSPKSLAGVGETESPVSANGQ